MLPAMIPGPAEPVALRTKCRGPGEGTGMADIHRAMAPVGRHGWPDLKRRCAGEAKPGRRMSARHATGGPERPPRPAARPSAGYSVTRQASPSFS